MIRIEPDNAEAHYWLGSAYEQLGRRTEAIAEYRETLRIDPKSTLARNSLREIGATTTPAQEKD